MSQEEADDCWRQNWEEQERASVREELEEFVETGELSREEADGYLEEIMVIRMAELPHAPSPDAFDPEEAHTRLRERVEELGERTSEG